MAILTKIFISSVAQDILSELRDNLFHTLKDLGHDPEMWEKTFSFPSYVEGVQHCLDKVKESQIYFLFIANKGGSYLDDRKKDMTVTHLEFRQAYEESKIIKVFIEKNVKSKFMSEIRWIIHELHEDYKKSNQGRRMPNDLLLNELRKRAGKRKSGIPSATEIDPYVWFFLYDIIMDKGLYGETLSLGVSHDWKSLLSELLKEGASLIPAKEVLIRRSEQVNLYESFNDLVADVLPKAKVKVNMQTQEEWRRFLTILRRDIKGGTIYREEYIKQTLGSVKDCSAIAVYLKEDQLMRKVGSEGDIREDEEWFDINDKDSFVSLTYNENSDTAMLFYVPDKKMFYLTWKVGEYVVSYHFPEDGSFNQQKFSDFVDDIKDGIIEVHANSLIFGFVNLLLGGMDS